VAAWQRFPYLDPGLPAELLPAAWEGQRAADVFFALGELLADRGERHAAAVLARHAS
jgi:phenylacetic acid degradation operon negative regulatory protein